MAACTTDGAEAQGVDKSVDASALKPGVGEEFQLPLDDETAAEIDMLVPQLSSPEFNRRERASARLTEVGAPAFARLRHAYHASDDLEVRLRIEDIVRQAYINHHVFERFGFLGIRRKMDPGLTHGDDPRIPKGHVGIGIDAVLEETAAARAGLQADDVIIALNGSTFQGDAVMAFQEFAKSIRESGAGVKVVLTILRSDHVMETDVVLGRMPRDSISQITGLQELYDAAMNELDHWWFRNFRKGSQSPP
ncbi:MAG: PDZ domain-containing protein [Phycisphaerae bacterium]